MSLGTATPMVSPIRSANLIQSCRYLVLTMKTDDYTGPYATDVHGTDDREEADGMAKEINSGFFAYGQVIDLKERVTRTQAT